MREIKFRAWDTKEKKYYYDGFYITPKGELLWRNVLEENQGHYILEQFSGPKDKNRKEIYEGDILQPYAYRQTKDLFGIVTWKEGAFYLIGSKLHRRPSLLSEALKAAKKANNEYEIIGNIHENPELLENGKE